MKINMSVNGKAWRGSGNNKTHVQQMRLDREFLLIKYNKACRGNGAPIKPRYTYTVRLLTFLASNPVSFFFFLSISDFVYFMFNLYGLISCPFLFISYVGGILSYLEGQNYNK